MNKHAPLTPAHLPTRYLDRLVAGLERKAGQEAKLLDASRGAERRRNEAKAQLVRPALPTLLLLLLLCCCYYCHVYAVRAAATVVALQSVLLLLPWPCSPCCCYCRGSAVRAAATFVALQSVLLLLPWLCSPCCCYCSSAFAGPCCMYFACCAARACAALLWAQVNPHSGWAPGDLTYHCSAPA